MLDVPNNQLELDAHHYRLLQATALIELSKRGEDSEKYTHDQEKTIDPIKVFGINRAKELLSKIDAGEDLSGEFDT